MRLGELADPDPQERALTYAISDPNTIK